MLTVIFPDPQSINQQVKNKEMGGIHKYFLGGNSCNAKQRQDSERLQHVGHLISVSKCHDHYGNI